MDVSIPCTVYLPGSEGFVMGTVIPPLIGNPYQVNFPSGSNHLLRIVMAPNIFAESEVIVHLNLTR